MISNIFKKSVELIKKEPILLLPALLFFFLYQTFSQLFDLGLDKNENSFTKAFLLLIASGWLIELFFKAFTICFAKQIILKNKSISFKTIMTSLRLYLYDLVIATGILTIPLFLFFLHIVRRPDSMPIFFLLTVLIGIIVISLCLPLVPIMVIFEELSWIKTLHALKKLLIQHWRLLTIFMTLILIFNFFSMIIAEAFNQIPLLGTSLFKVLIQGISTAFIYILTIFFYLEIKNKENENQSVNIISDDDNIKDI